MLRQSFAIGSAVLVLFGTSLTTAQTAEDAEAQYDRARTEMDQARRQLERAARTIAVQARAVPDFENPVFFRQNVPTFVSQAQIGVTITDADNGALVTSVAPGSGAEEAGLRVGDVIQSIDGIEVGGGEDEPSSGVIARLRDIEPGETVALAVERAGQSIELDVATSERSSWYRSLAQAGDGIRIFGAADAPATTYALGEWNAPYINVMRSLGFAASPWGDMELVAVSAELGRYFETSEGLLVIRAPEDDALDIRDGDVILSISGRTPNSPEHAIRILSSFESGETIEFSLMRDGRRQAVEYAIPAGDEPALALPVPD